MLYISLALSTVLFLVTLAKVFGAKDPQCVYLKFWFGVLFGILPVCCVLPIGYLTHAFALGFVATVCWLAGAGRPWFVAGSIAAFVGTYAAIGIPRALELRQLAKDNPLESLEDRLGYESRRPTKSSKNAGGAAPAAPLEADDYWMWSVSNGRFREEALKDLHTGCVSMFVNAPGFGVGRMSGYWPWVFRQADRLRDAPPLVVPEAPKSGESPPASTGDLTLAPANGSYPPEFGVPKNELKSIHRQNAYEFLNPLGYGYVGDLGHVAGFISHRFTKYPEKPTKPEGSGHWRIESLDLISLLKLPEPVAYVSKHLPRMDELRDAPTRPLDEFEAEQLPKLRAGEELEFAQGPRRLRMLGAIRARTECLKCHSVEANELLGAFSYDLRRDQ